MRSVTLNVVTCENAAKCQEIAGTMGPTMQEVVLLVLLGTVGVILIQTIHRLREARAGGEG